MTLHCRLESGIARSARASVPVGAVESSYRDDERLAEGLAAGTVSDNELDALLTERAVRLGERRDVLRRLALCRDLAIRDDDVEAMVGLARIAEAAGLLVRSGPTQSVSAADLAELRPLIARLRFVVLSELRRRIPGTVVERELIEHAFHTRESLRDRERDARAEWLAALNTYQSHPLLAAAMPAELEQELDAVLCAERRAPGQDRAPVDAAVVAAVRDLHLLPRFRLGQVVVLAVDGPHRCARIGTGVLAVALAGLAGYLTVKAHPALAALACAGVYLVITAGVAGFGESWAAAWLLRLPATATVGVLVLVTLPPAWWREWAAPTALPVVAGLLAASLGYLVVEARNHGVAAWSALARAVLVTLVGFAHAALVAMLALVAFLPAFADAGQGLAGIWVEPTKGLGVLLSAAAFCLTVGVFSQVLWDDRPVTARLAHMSWRSGGSI
jgi:hypothetical protein